MIGGLALLASLGGIDARADDGVFRLDPVFVSVFRAYDERLAPRARAIEAGLVDALEARHLVVPLDQVEPFEDYSAEIYLDSCPRDRGPGCAYVIGDRAGADWAVSGLLVARDADAVVIETSVLDVRGARAVVRFQVRIADDADRVDYASAVADLIDRLAAEGTDPAELRDDPHGTSRRTEAERAAAEREMLSASLDSLEGELGELDIQERGGAIEPPKLTDADLKRYREQEGATPWERYDLTAGQWQRMRNAGQDLVEWRGRLRGREGRVMVRLGLSGGSGPWEVQYDGRWVVDAAEGEVVEVDAHQQIVSGRGGAADLEIALGLTPHVDVALVASSRLGTFQYLLHPETLGNARQPNEPERAPVGSAMIGARGTVAFMPTSMVRPTAAAGLGLWLGPGLDQVVDTSTVPEVDPLSAARAVLVSLGPGVEAQASPAVQLFARLDLVVPVGGARLVEGGYGGGDLVYPGEPSGSWGLGVVAGAGIQASFGPLWGKPDPGRP